MNLFRTAIFIFFQCYTLVGLAQLNSDSLHVVWSNESLDTKPRLKAIGALVDHYIKSNSDSAFYYAEQLYEFAEKTGDKSGQAKALYVQAKVLQGRGSMREAMESNSRAVDLYSELADSTNEAKAVAFHGVLYMYSGQFEKSIHESLRALGLLEALQDKKGMSSCLTNLGTAYGQQGNYAQALHYLNRGRILAMELKDEQQLVTALNSIGLIYTAQKEYDKALECFFEVLGTSEKLNDERGIAGSCSNIGGVYEQLKEYQQALEYYLKSLEIAEKQGLVFGMLSLTSNLGNTYLNLGQLEKALDYAKRSIALANQAGLQARTAPPMLLMAEIYFKKKNMGQSKVYAEQALVIAQGSGQLEYIHEITGILTKIHRAQGNFKQALEMYELSIATRDSLRNIENQKAIIQQQFVFDYEKKSLADSLKQEEEKLQLSLQHREEVHKKNQTRNMLAAGSLLLLVIAGGSYGRMAYMRRTKDIIEKEKDRSDQLLLNILPEEIAEELKIKGKAEARGFELATVLFTDFKGFTEMSSSLSAHDLVEEINACFEGFDQIITDHGVEKIKTIGDAYMAVGGVPIPTEDSAKKTVLAACFMQAFIMERHTQITADGGNAFQMRVGIHTGPVVAGIVGVKKFQYDIWGDTVNTASRMESHGEVGKVNISQATYELIKDDPQFTFEYRGKIEAKGKGEVDMYFVSRA